MGVRIAFHGEEFKQFLKHSNVAKLERCAIVVQNEVKQSISEPSNHGATPSEPGESPHKDTGRLRASISHEVDVEAQAARVGTNVVYGKFLELGTLRMAARPFLRPALERCRAQIAAILGRK